MQCFKCKRLSPWCSSPHPSPVIPCIADSHVGYSKKLPSAYCMERVVHLADGFSAESRNAKGWFRIIFDLVKIESSVRSVGVERDRLCQRETISVQLGKPKGSLFVLEQTQSNVCTKEYDEAKATILGCERVIQTGKFKAAISFISLPILQATLANGIHNSEM